jgi:predicted AlkP superfamily phosphohydrolase/phosphomutase
MQARLVILSLDGLSADDCLTLSSLMPSWRKLTQSFDRQLLDAEVLSSAHAIWAEILTGSPWFKNGCSGYAKPTTSLNALAVTKETDLSMPSVLADTDDTTVSINFPLLMPKPHRIWLADGSLPINRLASPAKLLKEKPLSEYELKSVSSVALLQETITKVVTDILASELKRLECARHLFEREDWSQYLYRITAFDQLSHILGLNYLRANDLQCFSAIRNFINELDKFISTTCQAPQVDLAVVSAFSHVACRGLANLNVVLQAANFLDLEPSLSQDRSKSERVNAINPLINGPPPAALLRSMEGCLRTAETRAASPSAGCIYINRRELFKDGIVTAENYLPLRDQVMNYLQEKLTRTFGTGIKIAKKPESGDDKINGAADIVVQVDGVEFHNVYETYRTPAIPRTTHSPNGFALLPKGRSSEAALRPYELTHRLLPAENR